MAEMVRKVCDNPNTANATIAFLAGIPFVKMSATLGSLRSVGSEPGEIATTNVEHALDTDTAA